MNDSGTTAGTGLPARRWRHLSAALAVVAVTSGAAGWAVSSGTAARPDAPSGAEQVASRGTPGSLGIRATRPAQVRIATIDVTAPVVPMGLNKDQTVEVPHHPGDVGWYSLGPAPGEAGSAVLLGHVDSTSGPAVFSRLKSIRIGAEVDVVRVDGSMARFDVVSIATYPNERFPAQRVYRNHGRRSLTLVTCGGAYDRSRGGYQANVVVYAEYAGTTQRPSGIS